MTLFVTDERGEERRAGFGYSSRLIVVLSIIRAIVRAILGQIRRRLLPPKAVYYNEYNCFIC